MGGRTTTKLEAKSKDNQKLDDEQQRRFEAKRKDNRKLDDEQQRHFEAKRKDNRELDDEQKRHFERESYLQKQHLDRGKSRPRHEQSPADTRRVCR